MRKTDKAVLYPQKCLVTGRNDGPFVDLGVTIPAGRDTRLYLRTAQVERAGELVGMVPKAEYDGLKEQVREMERTLEEYGQRIDKFAVLVEALS